MEDKYPRVTQIQVDLWLVDPVTKAYLTCLQTSSKKLQDDIGSGKYLDSSNNDLSMNKIHKATGWREALDSMSQFDNILRAGQMIEVPKDEE